MIKSDMLVSVDRDTVNDYMIVKESMCSVTQYDPKANDSKWLTVRARPPKTSESSLKMEKYKENKSSSN